MATNDFSDQECIERCLTGKIDYFGILIERYQRMVTVVIKSKHREFKEDIVEELVQETFVRAYEKLEFLKDPKKFPMWIWSIAKNVVQQYIKDKQKELVVKKTIETTNSYHESTPLYEPHTLLNAIDHLSDDLREVVLLFYFSELKAKQIADILEVHISTVYKRLTTAYKQLCSLLSGKEISHNNQGDIKE